MKKAILIIGANGLIGKNIINQIRKSEKEYYIIGTSRNKKTNADYSINANDLTKKNCEKINNEIQELEEKEKIEINYIIYVAGIGYPEDKLDETKIKEMYVVNVEGVDYWSKKFKNAKFVLFSSAAVYGVTGTVGLETYSKYKREAEKIASKNNKNLIIVRPTTIETDFFKRGNFEYISTKGFPSPKKVAECTVKGMLNNKKIILPGWQGKVVHILDKINPKLAQMLLK